LDSLIAIYRSIVILFAPEAVLAEESDEEEDTGEERSDSQTSEGIRKVILDRVDARVSGNTKVDRCFPSEESGVANTSAAVLLFEELDPVFDRLEIVLLSE
jgi:hypothetical protein